MAYHQSALGQRGNPFADTTGFVPQTGDAEASFNYAGRSGPDPGDWEEWCRKADEFREKIESGIRRRTGGTG